ncbi:MAG: hypothetical protein WCL57_06815 [Chloroflexota bacterium]|jgi:hypothetical protein|nr:hypothetical protein [Chloroflexota bacterium]
MKSQAAPEFWQMYHTFSENIRRPVVAAYRLWLENPRLPRLRFKPISDTIPPYYSVGMIRNYRAVCELTGDAITYTFIVNHAEYERYIENL